MSENKVEPEQEAEVKPPRKQYVSKQERADFMKWLITRYDLLNEDRSKLPNPRILSEMYDNEKKVKISKVSIYRWIKSLDNYLDAEMNAIYDERVNSE